MSKWLWDKTGGHCAYCGIEFASIKAMTVDHVTPKSRGGSEHRDNKLPCCASCNRSKGGRHVEYLRDALQRRLVGRPTFTDEQIQYLEANSFIFPHEEAYLFYIERLGRSLPGGGQ